ncbi:hypothetical protein LTR93_006321 [Exophiala xenobiotica]|nr:hypothetical protein LTR93_006321 [Exophiala xenobiotica]
MSHISVSDSEYKALANKIIVISGASSGIGEAAVELASENGAKIVLGDVNEEAGEQVAKRCGGNVYFVKCNVASWQDWIKLVKKAHDLFGRIDIVIHNAGIYEKSDWLQDSYNQSGEKDVTALIEPTFPVIDVNLKGALYATKLALHYFRKQKDGCGSLMFTGSIASYIDSPPLWTYGATKTGILGLMRALRHQAEVEKIWTVNMAAPWMTC